MLLIFSAAIAAQGTLSLPAIFSNNMVLQREMALPFFGRGRPGEHVRVDLNGHFVEAVTKPNGTWSVKFRAMPAGGPYAVTVTGETQTEFHNVMIGEVWLASGQSNMEFREDSANDFTQAKTEADPNIRMFTVARKSSEAPDSDVVGSWVDSQPDTVGAFSAVGNSFAHELHRALGVPVGIIHSSWGGTPAESWTPRRALMNSRRLMGIVQKYLGGLTDFPVREAKYNAELAAWTDRVYKRDPGNEGVLKGWADYDAKVDDWRMVKLPNLLQVTTGQTMNGSVWYRKMVDLPPAWVGKALRLQLGPIADFDDTYVNGRKVGHTDVNTPFSYAVVRNYRVAPGLLRPGTNVIAVRVFNQYGPGGFTGGASQMQWGPEDASTGTISLAGDWISNVENRMDAATPDDLKDKPERPFGPGHPNAPGGLYNGMIAPFVGYAIRGVIWYQGETNTVRAAQYRDLFPSLIQAWRRAWGQGDFPFYFVQLPGYTERIAQPADSEWAELREAQSLALKLPNTGMAVTTDLGDANDIHPKNKREVGRRLAVIALGRLFGSTEEFSGPMFRGSDIQGATVRLRFDHAKGMKPGSGDKLTGFAIAGKDRKFVWADAKIDGGAVVVSSATISTPVAVRYAWANNPDCNLVNGAGLPASPFRTDDWPLTTEGRQ